MPDHSENEIAPQNGPQWPTWASFGAFMVGFIVAIVCAISFWIEWDSRRNIPLTPIECSLQKGCTRTMINGTPCAIWHGHYASGDYVMLCALNGAWRHVKRLEKKDGV